MKFSYEDLISGDDIFVDGIGHFRSPFLWELKPTQGIGIEKYYLYINILSWEKEEFVKFLKSTTGRNYDKLLNEKLNVFDVVTLITGTRKLLQEAIAFFIREDVFWNEQTRTFKTHSAETHEQIGKIDRDNFEDVKNAILQMNYVGIGKSAKPVEYSSERARLLWEKAQEYLKLEAKKRSENKDLRLGNIISKLSAVSINYNLLNIYNLTVFQLYDQFFQYGYLRAMDLSEAVYSNHGGDKFNMQDWLKTIFKF